jgi:hypothetical protein
MVGKELQAISRRVRKELGRNWEGIGERHALSSREVVARVEHRGRIMDHLSWITRHEAICAPSTAAERARDDPRLGIAPTQVRPPSACGIASV